MRFLSLILASLMMLAFAGCSNDEPEVAPSPFSLTAEAMGRYCGMNVLEHPGPKGQVILKNIHEAIWFSTVRDTIAFTMLPEEPKDIAAIYVSDMGKAANWQEPGADNWIDARKAFFVIGSKEQGGMNTAEAIPFGAREAAEAFVKNEGGRIVTFEEMPQDYILGPGEGEALPNADRSTPDESNQEEPS